MLSVCELSSENTQVSNCLRLVWLSSFLAASSVQPLPSVEQIIMYLACVRVFRVRVSASELPDLQFRDISFCRRMSSNGSE
jgi:hypothetical protein